MSANSPRARHIRRVNKAYIRIALGASRVAGPNASLALLNRLGATGYRASVLYLDQLWAGDPGGYASYSDRLLNEAIHHVAIYAMIEKLAAIRQDDTYRQEAELLTESIYAELLGHCCSSIQ